MAWYKKLRAKLQALAKLSWRDVLLLSEAWLTLAWVDLLIQVLPYHLWRGWLQTDAETSEEPVGLAASGTEAAKLSQIERIIRLTETAARHHLRPMNCLRRTLVQRKLLQRRGVEGEVQIGVRKAGAALEAHAWLCWQGRVLNDAEDVGERYARLDVYQWEGVGRFVD
ncbi:MAG: lasso peptide biosynthesis B2 protein [Halioglobus sp.]|nr:lasso peptide biosynthesis B2 protein [Halioglobus sp.]